RYIHLAATNDQPLLARRKNIAQRRLASRLPRYARCGSGMTMESLYQPRASPPHSEELTLLLSNGIPSPNTGRTRGTPISLHAV
ncbi:MAG: hypothetical protein U9R15_13495, partial [Chloroflexota bacterium]|nr:hypothetical protein [Chloroflexota bacterium]